MKIVQVKVYNDKYDFVFQQQYSSGSSDDISVVVSSDCEVKGHYIHVVGCVGKETVFVPHGFVFRVTELEDDEAAFFARGKELAKHLDKQQTTD